MASPTLGVDNLHERLSRLEAVVEQHGTNISAFRGDINEATRVFGELVTLIGPRVFALDAKIEILGEAVNGKLDGLTIKVDELTDKLDGLIGFVSQTFPQNIN